MSGERDAPGDRSRHEALFHGMADRLGRHVPQGTAAFDVFVERCRHCPAPGSCAAWQRDHQGHQAAPPAYCLNRVRLAAKG